MEICNVGEFFAFEVIVADFEKAPPCKLPVLTSSVTVPTRPGGMIESNPTTVHPQPGLTCLMTSTLSPVFLILNACLADVVFPAWMIPRSKFAESTEISGDENDATLPAITANSIPAKRLSLNMFFMIEAPLNENDWKRDFDRQIHLLNILQFMAWKCEIIYFY